MTSLRTASLVLAAVAVSACDRPPICPAVSPVYWSDRETALAVIELDRPAAEAVAANNAVLERACGA